jgi:hypothetical protein
VNRRKPAMLRWMEEAEAKQVCARAGLECRRPEHGAEASRGFRLCLLLLHLLRGLFASRTQFARDD